jgi:hydroxymethylglutaryl-CoA reductase (NADPH)
LLIANRLFRRKNSPEGVQFSIKNRLSDATVTGLRGIRIDGREIPLHDVEVRVADAVIHTHQITPAQPLDFPLKHTLQIFGRVAALPLGQHDIELVFESKPFGKLKLSVQDAIADEAPAGKKIPRDPVDDYSPEAIRARQAFVEEFGGAPLDHVKRFSFDPHLLKGNVEHFVYARRSG